MMSHLPSKCNARRIHTGLRLSLIFGVLLFAILRAVAQTVSIFPGEAPVPVVTPNVRLEFDTVSDKFYRIESSQDLSMWKPEGYAFAGTGRRMSALVSNHGLPRLFYRIRNNASLSETAPVIPYAAVAQNSSAAAPRPITAAEINPAKDQLVLMHSGDPEGTLRSIPLGELSDILGFTPRWGHIQGSISDQADLMSALNQKYSPASPPPWHSISDKPTTIFGYGITDAVSTSTIEFMDRFARYPEGSVIYTGKTFPEYGSAWRFNVTGKNRLGVNTISVSAADSSFNDSAGGFISQWLVPGDWLATSGFVKPGNNGRFRVTSVSPNKITVTNETGEPVTLTDEAAGSPRNLGGGYPPYMTNGALRAADKTLIYIGAPTRTTNGRFTMTFEVELKPSIYPSGIYPATITLGIKSSVLLLEQGGLNLGNLIHCQLNEAGVHDNGIYGLGPSFIPEGGGTHPVSFIPGKRFQRYEKYLIRCDIEGDEMRVSGLGGTIVYRDSRIPSMIGNPDTHWFYETGGDSLGNNLYANVWHLHRIWVNAPVLDEAVGWGVPDTQNMAAPQMVNQSTIPEITSQYANIQSAAGDVTQLIPITCAALDIPGAHQRTTIHGNFPNRNPKQVNLLVNGADVWSTGSLEDSGEWTIEMDRVKEPSGSYQIHIRYASESTRRFGYHQLAAELASDLVMNLKTSAFIDEDVIIRANLSSGSVDNER